MESSRLTRGLVLTYADTEGYAVMNDTLVQELLTGHSELGLVVKLTGIVFIVQREDSQ
jgi:hypothetical protein